MAIEFVGVSAQATATATPQTNVAIPAGVQEGDLLLLHCQGTSNFSSDMSFTPTPDWIALEDIFYVSGGMDYHLFYKFAGASESSPSIAYATASFPHGTSGQISAYRGVDLDTPFDVTTVDLFISAYTTIGPTESNPVIADITTVTDEAMIVISIANVAVSTVTMGTARGFTVRAEGDSYNWVPPSGQGTGFATADQLTTTAGVYEPCSFTQPSAGKGEWLIMTVVLMPLAAGGGGGLPALKKPIGCMVGLGKMMNS